MKPQIATPQIAISLGATATDRVNIARLLELLGKRARDVNARDARCGD
jgi:hypothetical protein